MQKQQPYYLGRSLSCFLSSVVSLLSLSDNKQRHFSYSGWVAQLQLLVCLTEVWRCVVMCVRCGYSVCVCVCVCVCGCDSPWAEALALAP